MSKSPATQSKNRFALPEGFDARQVPVLKTDGHLPCIPSELLTLKNLQSAFVAKNSEDAKRLSAALEMAKKPPESPYTYRKEPVTAAVLIGIQDGIQDLDLSNQSCAKQDTSLHVILTQRSAHLNQHAGQIAFPGGKVDESDTNIYTTALREAHEEISLSANDVEIWGALPAYDTGSGFRIHPVVAKVTIDSQQLKPNPTEVDAVFSVPLHFLLNPAHHQHHEWTFHAEGTRITRNWLSIFYNDSAKNPLASQPNPYHERFIWGVSAALIKSLYDFLSIRLSQI